MTFDQLRLGNRVIIRKPIPQCPGVKSREGVIVEFWYVPSRRRYRLLVLTSDQQTVELDAEKAHFSGEGFSEQATSIWIQRRVCGLRYTNYGYDPRYALFVIDGSTIPEKFRSQYIETEVHWDHRWLWDQNRVLGLKQCTQDLAFLRFMGLLSKDQLLDWGQRTQLSSRSVRLFNPYKETKHGS